MNISYILNLLVCYQIKKIVLSKNKHSYINMLEIMERIKENDVVCRCAKKLS